MQQPTLKMSPAKVQGLLDRDLEAENDIDLCRRETVPAISCVRVKQNFPARPTIRPKSAPQFLEVEATAAVVLKSAPPAITGSTPVASVTPITSIEDVDVRVDLETVFDTNEIRIVGHEARITHTAKPGDEHHRAEVIRRRGRALAVAKFTEKFPYGGSKLFIDVLPVDLLDPELYEEGTPLAKIASRVVLQLRGRLDDVMPDDLRARLSVLRFQGYRIAITDVDSAPARLSLIAEVAPEFLKIDATLIRGINKSEAKKRIVTGLTTMCRLLGTTAIAEGVATAEERAILMDAGCHVVQGPLHKDDDDYALPVRKDPPLRAVGGMRRR